MSTKIRSQISEANQYYISKHRYLELKNFCMQYPEWKEALKALNPLQSSFKEERINVGHQSDPTGDIAERQLYLSRRIQLLDEAAYKTHPVIGKWLLESIVGGNSYESMAARYSIPCGREMWYELYRRFFWLLDKTRN